MPQWLPCVYPQCSDVQPAAGRATVSIDIAIRAAGPAGSGAPRLDRRPAVFAVFAGDYQWSLLFSTQILAFQDRAKQKNSGSRHFDLRNAELVRNSGARLVS